MTEAEKTRDQLPDERAVAADLFRREAINAASSRLGAPVRPVGLAGWGLTAFLLTLFLAVAIFLSVGHYTRKESVEGILQPKNGAARVMAFSPGVITQLHVVEGQRVKIGDPIITLSTDSSVSGEGSKGPSYLSDMMEAGSRRERSALTAQASAQVQINSQAIADIEVRRKAILEDQAELAGSADLQRERVRLAQETFEAGRALHERELFSTLQLRQREEALIAAKQGVDEIERDMRRNQGALSQLTTEAGRLAAQLRQAQAEQSLSAAQLDQRDASRLAEKAIVLVAQSSGTIVGLQARNGAAVQPGRALATVLADGETLQAELWVPSRAVGFLSEGDAVRLMYDAFPYQKFGVGHGRVTTVAGAPTNPEDLSVPIEAHEALYRVVVDVDTASVAGYGRRWSLTPGMHLKADLILDKRSLWEWLLDPIIAIQRRGK